jgi:hypothetical protein
MVTAGISAIAPMPTGWPNDAATPIADTAAAETAGRFTGM